jgi:hypothetical protein
MCTLLHPSLKHFEIAPNEKTKAFNLVKQELLKRTPAPALNANIVLTAPVVRDTTAAATSHSLLTRCFDQPQPKLISTSTSANELENYMALDTQISENDDVLLFWKENTKLFPQLSTIVRDLFAIPASNTIVERLFSSSKNTVTDRRCSLAAEKINKLLFLKKNLFNLKEINEEKLKINKEQSKRRLSMSDDLPILLSENNDDLISSPTTKRPKKDDDSDYSSNDIEDIDNDVKSDHLL